MHQPFTDTTIMPVGRHFGKKLANVPSDYLIWIYNNDVYRVPALREYIKDNMEVLKKGSKQPY